MASSLTSSASPPSSGATSSLASVGGNTSGVTSPSRTGIDDIIFSSATSPSASAWPSSRVSSSSTAGTSSWGNTSSSSSSTFDSTGTGSASSTLTSSGAGRDAGTGAGLSSARTATLTLDVIRSASSVGDGGLATRSARSSSVSV